MKISVHARWFLVVPLSDQRELREVMSLVVLLNEEAKTVNNVEDTADQGMTMGGKTNTEDERLIH